MGQSQQSFHCLIFGVWRHCGLFIDHARSRAVVAVADVIGYTYGAAAAYASNSWKCLFFTLLSFSGKTYFS